MPSYEEVTQRAGSLRAMTGLTEQEFTALLPPFEHALGAYLRDRAILWRRVVECITFAQSIDHGTMPTNKY
jgi:hypothetical protein